MKTVIFLGSYSGGGASTAIKLLREMGIPCVSTNEILYDITRMIDALLHSRFNMRDEAITKDRECRKHIAEDVIKGQLDRSAFTTAAVNRARPLLQEFDVVVIDCFDTNDYVFARNYLGNEFSNVILNIRSSKEQQGIDGQSLLEAIALEPVHTIQNPMTIEGLKAELEEVLAIAKVPKK